MRSSITMSNKGLGCLRVFEAQQGTLTFDEFVRLDQRITSGLGRRRVPLVVRTGERTFKLTREAKEILRSFDDAEIFRHTERTSIAAIFDTSRRRSFSRAA